MASILAVSASPCRGVGAWTCGRPRPRERDSAARARRGLPVPRDLRVLEEDDVIVGPGTGDRVVHLGERGLEVVRVEDDLELSEVVGLGHLGFRQGARELLARLLVA